MPTVLISRAINEKALEKYRKSLLELALNEAPIKLLQGQFANQKLFSTRINDKIRIIFTYTYYKEARTPLVLAIHEEHNYNKLQRQLTGLGKNIEEYQAQEKAHEDAKEYIAPAKEQERQQITYKPVACFNEDYIELDDQQEAALKPQGPTLLIGPPGSGKTLVLYTRLLESLKQQGQASPPAAAAAGAAAAGAGADNPNQAPILFVSPSQQLINKLREDFALVANDHITFISWKELLKKHYPNHNFLGDKVFKQYYQEECATLGIASPEILHFELSLYAVTLATPNAKPYTELGSRQSHFSGQKAKQKRVAELYQQWTAYLQKEHLIDPVITLLPTPKQGQFRVYCDETQNMPPTALLSLLQQTKNARFIAALDSEQCLNPTTLFIQNCLKDLLFLSLQQKFQESHLERTWRCPEKVMEVANHLLAIKYQFNKNLRRAYAKVGVNQPIPGLVSWVDDKNLDKLKPHTALPTTVVIVPEQISPQERASIQHTLNCQNILTAKEAIGLEFKVVILWKPLSASPLRDLCKDPLPLESTPEQECAMNAFFVAATRAREAFFIHEEQRFYGHQALLGNIPKNNFDIVLTQLSQEEQNKQWDLQIKHHLEGGNFEVATNLMQSRGYTQKDIQQKINQARGIQPPKPVVEDVKTPAPVNNAPLVALPPKSSRKKKKRAGKSFPSQAQPAVQIMQPPTPRKITPPTQSIELFMKQIEQHNKIKRQRDYIGKLIDILNKPIEIMAETRIIGLFRHKNAHEILFNYPIESDIESKNGRASHLFEFILSLVEKRGQMNSFLKYIAEDCDPTLFNKECEGEHIFNTVLYCIVCNEKTPLFFQTLLEQYPDFAKKIKAESFYKLNSLQISPFTYLATFPGAKPGVIQTIFQKNPDLIGKMPGVSLHLQSLSPKHLDKDNIHLAPSTVFQYLLRSTVGKDVLKTIFNAHQDAVKKISIQIILPIRDSLDSRYKPLYYLVVNAEGCSLFNIILSKNSELVYAFTASWLLYKIDSTRPTDVKVDVVNKELYDFLGPCALFYLLFTSQGMEILNTLFEKIPTLISDMYCLIDRDSLLTLCKRNDKVNGILQSTEPGIALQKTLTTAEANLKAPPKPIAAHAHGLAALPQRIFAAAAAKPDQPLAEDCKSTKP